MNRKFEKTKQKYFNLDISRIKFVQLLKKRRKRRRKRKY